MKLKKLYYVKREVLATSMASALLKKGFIYEISLAPDSVQPNPPKKLGLTLKKSND